MTTLDRFDIEFVLRLVRDKYGDGLWRHRPRLSESVANSGDSVEFDILDFTDKLTAMLPRAEGRQ